MSYYEVKFQSLRFLLKHGTVYYVLDCVTVFYLSCQEGNTLCICGHAKKCVKPNSHAVLSVFHKRNILSLNKFNIMWNRKQSLDDDIFIFPTLKEVCHLREQSAISHR